MKYQIELDIYGLESDIDKKLTVIARILERVDLSGLQLVLHSIKPNTYFTVEKNVAKVLPAEVENVDNKLGIKEIKSSHIFYIADLLDKLEENELETVLKKVHPVRLFNINYLLKLADKINDQLFLITKQK